MRLRGLGEWDRRQKAQGGSKGRARRETGDVSRIRVRRARVPNSFVKRAYLTAECAFRKRGERLLSCQRRPLNLPADLFTIVPCPWPGSPAPSIPPSCLALLVGRFRHVILLLYSCDGPSDFSRFLIKWWSLESKEETVKYRYCVYR